MLTQANYPVYMSQQTFFQMLFTPDSHQWSKLESFLASSILVRQFSKAVSEPTDSNNPTVSLEIKNMVILFHFKFKVRSVPNEQDTYRFEHLSLQLSFLFNLSTTIYRVQLISLFDSTIQQQQSHIYWSPDELETVEVFLNDTFFPISPLSKLTMPSIDALSLHAPQNHNTSIGAFGRMLSLINPRVFKDLVKIISLEQVESNFDNFQ